MAARGRYAPRDSVKLSFVLVPHPRSRLPELPAGANRLSAPRALKLARVAAHVERTLSQAGVALDADDEEGAIVLFCGEKQLPADMSLLTALVFLWKQGGDMMLTYAERKGGRLH